MDLIMEGAENVITYIDDVLIHSKNHNEHMGHLEEAIKRVQRAHLRLNARKFFFAATSVQYLGHTLSSEGVTPGNSKLEAIQKLAPPKNTKQLKSFLGLANYFRQYINGFSKIAEPFFKLTRKDAHWPTLDKNFPADAVRAFNELKAAITSKPVLAYPNRGGKFTLMVDSAQGDANNCGGMGATLLQEQPNGTTKPVGYASRQLYKYENNYPSFLLELPYLEWSTFTIT